MSSGGASKFLECLKTEIIPFVEKNYKTSNDRGIAGHSLGGLLSAYCFINSDGYFKRFGINSPSFWWSNEKLLNQAVTQINNNKTWDIPSTKVYISVGEKESAGVVPTMLKFSKLLEWRSYENVQLTYQIFHFETHLSVMNANMSRTLSVLYGKE